MPVTSTNAYSGPFTVSGTTPVSFDFQAASADEILVTLDGAELDSGQYTVELNGDDTGTVTPVSSWSGEVYIYSNPDFRQNADWGRFAPYFPDQLVPPLDRLAKQQLYLKDRVDRAAILPVGGGVEGKFPVVLPDGSFGFSGGTGADAGLRQDLGATGGASLVRAADGSSVDANLSELRATGGVFTQDAVGAIPRTHSLKLREAPVSLFDFMLAADEQDIRDGTNTRSFSLELQALFDECTATGRRGILPATPTPLRLDTQILVNTVGPYQGAPKVIGQGMWKTIFDTRVSNDAAFAFTNSDGDDFSMSYGLHLEGFGIVSLAGTAGADGIRLQGQWGPRLEKVRVQGLDGDGLDIVADTAGDLDTLCLAEFHRLWLVGNRRGVVARSPGGGVALAQSVFVECYVTNSVEDGFDLAGIDGVTIDNCPIANNGANGGANNKGGIYLRQSGITSRNFALIGNNEVANSNRGYHLKIDGLANGIIRRSRFVTNDSDFLTPVDIILGNGVNLIRNVEIDAPMLISGTRARTFLQVAANIAPANNVRLRSPDLYQFSSGNGQVLVDNPSRINLIETDGARHRAPPIRVASASVAFGVPHSPNMNDATMHRLTLVTSTPSILGPTTGAAGPRDGEKLLFTIFNASGGDVTPTFAAAYVHTAPLIAAGKTRAGAFRWVPGEGKWVMFGQWSADY